MLFNSVDTIVFHFFKVCFELAEAFFEDTCHTHKQISNLLSHRCIERCFNLWIHSFEECFSVPLLLLALLTERYEESFLDSQNFSDNDLYFIFGLLALALNNTVFIKDLDDSVMHLDK